MRLIGGERDSLIAKQHAEELINQANKFKESIQ
jgi:hypothetical protein